MSTASQGTVTLLLSEIQAGNDEATDQLIEVVYTELRQLAGNLMRQERVDHTLEPTALVHETCARLLQGSLLEKANNRTHLFGAVTKAMRRILIDHARKRGATKRGGHRQRVPLDDAVDAFESRLRIDILALDDALDKLAQVNSRHSTLIQFKFYGGIEMKEIADLLGVSLSTVEEDWRFARAWLHRELSGGDANA